jgi:integrase/recombinase XerD
VINSPGWSGIGKIFINRGKGAKDRYILFPASFRLVLKSHLHAAPRNRYLFETRRFGPFTTRRIQQIVQGCREMAGITQPLHPHLFRHQMLTYLTSKGLSDAQIQIEQAVASDPDGNRIEIVSSERRPLD